MFNLYKARFRGDERNFLYPDKVSINGAEDLAYAAKFDHVAAKYKDNHRSVDNFEVSDCILEDCDNDHSDNPNEWITPEKLAEAFPDVTYAVVMSRNNGKAKGKISARPRFHVYFAVKEVSSVEEYKNLKKQILDQFPFFDKNAQDAARFLYGVETPEIIWHEGNKTIDEFLDEKAFADWDKEMEAIPEGKRNATMSHFAGKIIKRYGDTDKAREVFFKKAEMCNPPLEDTELSIIWNSARRFFKKISKDAGYKSPEEYENSSLRPMDFSDAGQAEVFISEYAKEVRFTTATGYLRFNGQFWRESEQQAIAASKELTDRQLEEARAELEQAMDSAGNTNLKTKEPTAEEATIINKVKSAEAYVKFVMSRRSVKNIFGTVKIAESFLEIGPADLDKNPFLLNTPVGTCDLRTGEIKPHNPDDLITKMTRYAPGDKGAEIWKEAVLRTFSNDQQVIDYVQKVVGVGAVGKVFLEALIIAYGEGKNGKSTFWNAIAQVLGTYSGALSSDTLTVGCKRNVKPEMAELKGVRFVISTETQEGVRLNTSTVKQICSTDEIFGEKKYKTPFKFKPSHTVVLYTNHLPKVGANDRGIWRRLIVILFTNTVSADIDIKNYGDYLAENAGEAIMKWIIEGAKKAISDNYKLELPDSVKAAINEYRESNDWLGHFLEACCELGTELEEKSGEFYSRYRAYCNEVGEYTRGTTDFYAALGNVGITCKRTNKGRFVKGVKLKSEFLD